MRRLRETPTRIGRPKAARKAPVKASALRFCALVLPKPIPDRAGCASAICRRDRRASSERSKKRLRSASNVEIGIDALAVVHDHDRGAGSRPPTSAIAGSLCSPQTSLTTDTPERDRAARDFGLSGVDRKRRGDLGQERREQRLEAAPFLFERNRRVTGPRRFRPDVDDVGAVGDKLARLRERGDRAIESARRRKRSPASR